MFQPNRSLGGGTSLSYKDKYGNTPTGWIGSATFKPLGKTTIAVGAPPLTVPAITSGTPPAATQSVAYTFTFTASGSPSTWAVTVGSLPAGFTLNSATGVLSGSSASPGTTSFTVTATNGAGTASLAVTFSVAAPSSGPTITSGNPPSVVQNVPYGFTFTATGSGPITWGSTTLPTGLSLNSTTGVLSGTPTVVATTSVVFSATDLVGTTGTTKSIVVSAPTGTIASATWTLQTPGYPTGYLNSATYPNIYASGRIQSYVNAGDTVNITPTFGGSPRTGINVVSNNLPAGITFDTSTGIISGTQSSPVAGTFTVQFTIDNSAGRSAVQSFSLFFNPVGAPKFTNVAENFAGTLGTAFSKTLAVTGTGPMNIQVGLGPLPDGIALNSTTGVLSGTPTLAGQFFAYFTAAGAVAANVWTPTESVQWNIAHSNANAPVQTSLLNPAYYNSITDIWVNVAATGSSITYQWQFANVLSPTALATWTNIAANGSPLASLIYPNTANTANLRTLTDYADGGRMFRAVLSNAGGSSVTLPTSVTYGSGGG